MKKWNYEARERELNFRFLNLCPTGRRIRLLWRFPVSEPINAKYQTYNFKLSIKPKKLPRILVEYLYIKLKGFNLAKSRKQNISNPDRSRSKPDLLTYYLSTGIPHLFCLDFLRFHIAIKAYFLYSHLVQFETKSKWTLFNRFEHSSEKSGSWDFRIYHEAGLAF